MQTTPLRIGLRAAQNTFRQQPSALRQNLRFTQRRTYQSAAENPAHVAAPKAAESGLQRLWNSPVGPKTVHFWAPIMKWGIVLAGAADFARPADQLSLTQNLALMCTGAIWTRWCFVIKPRNLFLASVNFLLFCVGAAQATRVFRYQASLEGDSVEAEVGKAAREEEGVLKSVVEHPGKVVEAVKNPK